MDHWNREPVSREEFLRLRQEAAARLQKMAQSQKRCPQLTGRRKIPLKTFRRKKKSHSLSKRSKPFLRKNRRSCGDLYKRRRKRPLRRRIRRQKRPF